jgi:hypothetical protein
MGIMTRKQGSEYVITSDRGSDDSPTNRAPKRAMPDAYEVWTGTAWSTSMPEAKTFATLDAADEYVRANYSKVTGQR